MKLFRNGTKVAIALLVLIAGSSVAQAQLPRKLSDLDPTNKNSTVRKAASGADAARLDAMAGQPYSFVIRNPTSSAVKFQMGAKPFLVLNGQQLTINGRGTPEVTFDLGVGDGSFKAYTLTNGRTYEFVVRTGTDKYGATANYLDLVAPQR